MRMLADGFTILSVIAGLVFFIAGTAGLLRFPDTASRLHALTKADHLGLGLIVLGLLPQADGIGDALRLLRHPRPRAAVERRGRSDDRAAGPPAGRHGMTIVLLTDLLLAGTILAAAMASILARRAFTAVAMFIAYGLLLALAWVRLGAVDVALTEAAIGAGLSGVLLLGAVRRRGAPAVATSEPAPGRVLTVLIGLGCAGVAAALGAVILLLPEPAPSLAAEVVANLPCHRPRQSGDGVLMSFRALDTLLESAVVLLAVVCVWALAPEGGWGGVPGARCNRSSATGHLALLARALPPLGIVVAVHILWVGADAPGGKFQAAAILAAMWLLPWMAGPRRAAAHRRARLAPGARHRPGGLHRRRPGSARVTEGAFLAYPPGWAKPLILVIEIVLTASIAVALALLRHRAAGAGAAAMSGTILSACSARRWSASACSACWCGPTCCCASSASTSSAAASSWCSARSPGAAPAPASAATRCRRRSS